MKKLLIALCFVCAPVANAKNTIIDPIQPIKSIYWSDGDSGRITFESGPTITFLLNDLDAPETGGVGAAIGGAKCEKERELGFLAKEFVVTYTKDREVAVQKFHGWDRYGRHIVDLSIDGESLYYLATHFGSHRSWWHEGSKPLEPKPDWCS